MEFDICNPMYVNFNRTTDGHTGSFKDQLSLNDLNSFLLYLNTLTEFENEVVIKTRGRASGQVRIIDIQGNGIRNGSSGDSGKNLLRFESIDPINDIATIVGQHIIEGLSSSSTESPAGTATIHIEGCSGLNLELTKYAIVNNDLSVYAGDNSGKCSLRMWNNFILTNNTVVDPFSSSSPAVTDVDPMVIIGNNWEALIAVNQFVLNIPDSLTSETESLVKLVGDNTNLILYGNTVEGP